MNEQDSGWKKFTKQKAEQITQYAGATSIFFPPFQNIYKHNFQFNFLHSLEHLAGYETDKYRLMKISKNWF